MQTPAPAADAIWFGTQETQSFDLFPVCVAACVLTTGECQQVELVESASDLPKLVARWLEESIRRDYMYRLGGSVMQHLQARREALERTQERKNADVSLDMTHLEAVAATIRPNEVDEISFAVIALSCPPHEFSSRYLLMIQGLMSALLFVVHATVARVRWRAAC